MQGIKFYEPEVVGDTPEAVEYLGMQNLLTAVKEHVGYRHGKLIFSADGQVGFVMQLNAERDAQQYTGRFTILVFGCFSVLWYLCILLLLSRLV